MSMRATMRVAMMTVNGLGQREQQRGRCGIESSPIPFGFCMARCHFSSGINLLSASDRISKVHHGADSSPWPLCFCTTGTVWKTPQPNFQGRALQSVIS